MKIYVFGSTGYFGDKLTEHFLNWGDQVCTERVDIRDYDAVEAKLKERTPEVVINAAGVTGRPNVDWCEDHQEETHELNVGGAINVAKACKKLGIYFVQLSSGCIYSGDNDGKSFSETDAPNFDGSFYARTKTEAEKAIDEIGALQLRIRIPIDHFPHPKNLIDKLLGYEKIVVAENSFTVVEDFLEATQSLINKRATGIFNMTNPGHTNHQFIMEQYQKIVDPDAQFEYISEDQLDQITKAPRSNCVLNTDKREKLGVKMPPITKRIPSLLREYKSNL